LRAEHSEIDSFVKRISHLKPRHWLGYFFSGSTTVFDEPSGADCMPGGVSPCGVEAGAPLVVVVIGAGPALRLQLTLGLGRHRAAGAVLRFVRVFGIGLGLRRMPRRS
jgi:hypothetical protein